MMRHYILAGGFLLALFVGCTKDLAVLKKSQTPKDLETKAYTKLAKLSNADRYNFFEQKRFELNGLQKTAAQPDYELEDAFLALEGLVNNDFYEYWEDFIERIDYSPTFQLAYTLVDGERRVSVQEFASVYAEIYDEVDGLVDTANDEMLLMVDLMIESYDDNSQLATLKAIISIATKPAGQVFFTPATAITGTKWAPGPCNLEGTATWDAADFIRVYANTTAPWRSLNCPNQLYLSPTGGMNTYNYSLNNPVAFPSLLDWQQNVIPKYWKSNTNDCLGSPDPFDWYPWYTKIDQLIAYGLIKNQIHYNNYSLQFLMTDYHSHINQSSGPGSGPNPDIPELYYHGGSISYGIVTCY